MKVLVSNSSFYYECAVEIHYVVCMIVLDWFSLGRDVMINNMVVRVPYPYLFSFHSHESLRSRVFVSYLMY